MTEPSSEAPRQKLRWSRYHSAFVMMPVGVGMKDRLKACLGALVGIALTGLSCRILAGHGASLPLLIAPMGASAVLLFAVPASPLAQPWSIIGGNVISALVGVAVGRMISDPTIAAGAAAGTAIAAMSLLRCLHPPGGAVALTAVLGGSSIAASGFMFALVPVGLNSLLLVCAGYLFHRLSGHSYPHVAPPPAENVHGTRDPSPNDRIGFTADDIGEALKDYGETLDVSRDDLDSLFRQVEIRAAERLHGELLCADIMSRDLVTIGHEETPEAARALMLAHALQFLPVLDGQGRVQGSIGHLDLSRPGNRVENIVSPAVLAGADTPAARLLAPLSDGRAHGVLIVDQDRKLIGIITQTDLLAAMARAPVSDPMLHLSATSSS